MYKHCKPLILLVPQPRVELGTYWLQVNWWWVVMELRLRGLYILWWAMKQMFYC